MGLVHMNVWVDGKVPEDNEVLVCRPFRAHNTALVHNMVLADDMVLAHGKDLVCDRVPEGEVHNRTHDTVEEVHGKGRALRNFPLHICSLVSPVLHNNVPHSLHGSHGVGEVGGRAAHDVT